MSGPTFQLSELQQSRQKYTPALPRGLSQSECTFSYTTVPVLPSIQEKFPLISRIQYVEFLPTDAAPEVGSPLSPLRVGVVLSGGQAPGGHNVIMGVFDYIKRHHPSSQLFGFLGGPRGIFSNKYVEIDEELMGAYRNQGGFDMICSGRDKIESAEQYASSLKYCTALNLDGLVVIGGDDSNTNAALLADYFLAQHSTVRVVGCPKTIDGDLKNEFIEISFGFDTATKTYSEFIGNLCFDVVSTKKYYHFIRLMGRSASHIALECALQTRANLVLIGEEVEQKRQTLSTLVGVVTDMVVARGRSGKAYGVILVPEGLIEFIPEMNALISELNDLLAGKEADLQEFLKTALSPHNRELFFFLPQAIQQQLLADRDPHGNVQVAKIETERLLILLVEAELVKRQHSLPFLAQAHYFGYEGRACLPTNFDATYCYALGNTAAALVKYSFTGCIAVCRNLHLPPADWKSAGCPLATMMHLEKRKGKDVPVIKKALVELDSPVFLAYQQVRESWMLNDCYRPPGPIQFGELHTVNFMITPPLLEDLQCPAEDNSQDSPYFKRNLQHLSTLGRLRLEETPALPSVFEDAYRVGLGDVIEPETQENRSIVNEQYPRLAHNKHRRFAQVLEGGASDSKPLKIGVVYLGRPGPGAHNVIDGLLRVLKMRPGSVLLGFLGGNTGLYAQHCFSITEENFHLYRNTGGIDFLGRDSDGLREPVFPQIKVTCESLALDGLVIIGATHSLTDAAKLANYFLEQSVCTKVVGVPSTVDGNINHPLFEMTIGFDTASRVNSYLIGNMLTDASSATKYFYFIRLMGKDPSRLVLESGLQTHANLTIISELFKREGLGLDEIVEYIADVVQARARASKMFGTVIIPEGLLNQLPHFRSLFLEISTVMKGKTRTEREALALEITSSDQEIHSRFHQYTAPVLRSLPKWFQLQMLTRIDANGAVLLSLVETERLLAEKTSAVLKERRKRGEFEGAFAPICHFFGYQSRCSFPSTLDCSLGSTYGAVAGALVGAGLTGYMTTARGLTGPTVKWRVGAIPLTALMRVKGSSQYGRNQAVVPSSDVDLHAKAYQHLALKSREWVLGDHFSNPGPLQFLCKERELVNLTLQLDHQNYLELFEEISQLCERIQSTCRFGVHEDLLRTAAMGLSTVEGILKLHNDAL